jgi:hypothetical protein
MTMLVKVEIAYVAFAPRTERFLMEIIVKRTENALATHTATALRAS